MYIGLRYDEIQKAIVNDFDVVVAPNILNARFAFHLMNCHGELQKYLGATTFLREAIQCGFVWKESFTRK